MDLGPIYNDVISMVENSTNGNVELKPFPAFQISRTFVLVDDTITELGSMELTVAHIRFLITSEFRELRNYHNGQVIKTISPKRNNTLEYRESLKNLFEKVFDLSIGNTFSSLSFEEITRRDNELYMVEVNRVKTIKISKMGKKEKTKLLKKFYALLLNNIEDDLNVECLSHYKSGKVLNYSTAQKIKEFVKENISEYSYGFGPFHFRNIKIGEYKFCSVIDDVWYNRGRVMMHLENSDTQNKFIHIVDYMSLYHEHTSPKFKFIKYSDISN